MVSPGRVRRGQGDQESYISAGVPSCRWGQGGVRALTTQHFIFQCPPLPRPALIRCAALPCPAPFASKPGCPGCPGFPGAVVFPGAWARVAIY